MQHMHLKGIFKDVHILLYTTISSFTFLEDLKSLHKYIFRLFYNDFLKISNNVSVDLFPLKICYSTQIWKNSVSFRNVNLLLV